MVTDPKTGLAVYVAEWGHGARSGTVARSYTSADPGKAGERIVVAFDEGGQRDCFATSVFTDRIEAERATYV